MKQIVEKKVIGIIISFSFIIVFILAAVIWPTVLEIARAQKETYKLRLFLEQKNQQTLRARVNRARNEEVGKMVEKFPDYLFLSGQELKLITELEAIALNHHVIQKIKSNNLDNITNQRLTLSLSATGNYHDILAYLSTIESLPYFLIIKKLYFTGTTDPVLKNETYSLDLDLSLYVSTLK